MESTNDSTIKMIDTTSDSSKISMTSTTESAKPILKLGAKRKLGARRRDDDEEEKKEASSGIQCQFKECGR